MCRSEGRCSFLTTSPKEHTPLKVVFLPTESRKASKILCTQKLFQNKFTSMGSVHLSSPRLLIAFFFFLPSLYYTSSGCANYLFIFILSFSFHSLFSLPLFFPPCVCGSSGWSVACYHPLHAPSCSRGVSIQTSASSCHINYYTE